MKHAFLGIGSSLVIWSLAVLLAIDAKAALFVTWGLAGIVLAFMLLLSSDWPTRMCGLILETIFLCTILKVWSEHFHISDYALIATWSLIISLTGTLVTAVAFGFSERRRQRVFR